MVTSQPIRKTMMTMTKKQVISSHFTITLENPTTQAVTTTWSSLKVKRNRNTYMKTTGVKPNQEEMVTRSFISNLQRENTKCI